MAFRNMRLEVKGSEKISNGLAWLSWIFAVIGGAALSGSFIGSGIGKMIHGLPIYINVLLGVVGGGLVLRDLFEDGIPDKLRTAYLTILWPSWVLGAQGKGAKYVNGWIKDLNDMLYKKVGPWISDNPSHTSTRSLMTLLAVIFVTLALMWAHAYYSKNRGAGSAPATNTAVAGGGGQIIGNRKQRR